VISRKLSIIVETFIFSNHLNIKVFLGLIIAYVKQPNKYEKQLKPKNIIMGGLKNSNVFM
jgi:hypothetical protein